MTFKEFNKYMDERFEKLSNKLCPTKTVEGNCQN